MEPAAIYVLLVIVIAIITVGIPLFVNAIKDVNKAIRNTHGQCDKISERQVAVETKVDMLLEIAGLDNHKVNRAIKEHMEELKNNNQPSVGCINMKELYREKPGG
jgi:hypothetical protein